jgi:hypothetical protein
MNGVPFLGRVCQVLSDAAEEHHYRSRLWVPLDLLDHLACCAAEDDASRSVTVLNCSIGEDRGNDSKIQARKKPYGKKQQSNSTSEAVSRFLRPGAKMIPYSHHTRKSSPTTGNSTEIMFVNFSELQLGHNVDLRSFYHRCVTRNATNDGTVAAVSSDSSSSLTSSSRGGWGPRWALRNVVGGGFPADVAELLEQFQAQHRYTSLNWVEEHEIELLGWSLKQNAACVVVAPPTQLSGPAIGQPPASPTTTTTTSVERDERQSQWRAHDGGGGEPTKRSCKKYYNIECVVDEVSFDDFFLRDRRMLKVASLSNHDSQNNQSLGLYFSPAMTLHWQVHLSCFLGLDAFEPLARIGGTSLDFTAAAAGTSMNAAVAGGSFARSSLTVPFVYRSLPCTSQPAACGGSAAREYFVAAQLL